MQSVFLLFLAVAEPLWQWVGPTSQPSENPRSGPSMGRRSPFMWVWASATFLKTWPHRLTNKAHILFTRTNDPTFTCKHTKKTPKWAAIASSENQFLEKRSCKITKTSVKKTCWRTCAKKKKALQCHALLMSCLLSQPAADMHCNTTSGLKGL